MLNVWLNLVILFVMIGALVFLRKYSNQRASQKYDERQLLMQKKAYADAAWGVAALSLVLAIEGDYLKKYMALSFVGYAFLFLVVGIFVCSSILSDAYFSETITKRFAYFYIFIVLSYLIATVHYWIHGSFVLDGHLYLTGEKGSSLLGLLTFSVIFLVTFYKIIQDKKGAEE
ncbi:hypothetical protein [Streptococcus dentiloxodontae]